MKKNKRFVKEKQVFEAHHGLLHSSEAVNYGIHPRELHSMVADGVVERMSRGLYRLSTMPPLSNPDLTTVALRTKKGVICLISALSYHLITDEVPHVVDIALPFSARAPKIEWPPARFYRFKEPAFSAGIETKIIDGIPVRIYCPEKTVADCFKFRNHYGLDVAIEALKRLRQKRGFTTGPLMRYAKICRVENVMRPYLEAIL